MSNRRRLGAVAAASLLAAAFMPSAVFAQAPMLTEAELRALAEGGDAEALNDLGSAILVSEDQTRLAEARELFRRSSEAGSPDGKNSYAIMLVLGLGGPQDEQTGERLREEAAAEGSMAAVMTLGEAYRKGRGRTRDPVRALSYLRRAAEGGRNEIAQMAQWHIGMMYLNGEGVVADPAEAYRWVSRSADGGWADGMISRAVMLALGQGVVEDDADARRWYERATLTKTSSVYHALRGLGFMLVRGEGGPVEVERGLAYLLIAKAGGDGNADPLVQQVQSQLSDQQVERAFEIAHAWMAQHMPDAQEEAPASPQADRR